MPCGRCRQLLWEHGGAECLIDTPAGILLVECGAAPGFRGRRPGAGPKMSIDLEALQAFPKVSLHDHLDGGLRPQTIIELAADIGHQLPADNADDLGRWFARVGGLRISGALPGDLRSNARGHADSSESAQGCCRVCGGPGRRWSHLRRDALGPRTTSAGGLDQAEASRPFAKAWPRGWLPAGRAVTRSRYVSCSPRCGRPIRLPTSLNWRCAIARMGSRASISPGQRTGFPPARFLESFQLLRRQSAYYTIHAGEADGCESVWEAVQVCGANRIGHGVAIIDDIQQDERGRAVLGDFAAYVLNRADPARDVPVLQCADRSCALDQPASDPPT